MSRLVEFLLSRPRLAAAFALAAVLAGLLALPSLPLAFFPTVSRPSITVSCSYPGANAREVMNTVAGPIEDQVNGVEGFAYMTSSCSDTGSYSLTVYFQSGFDRDLALMKVQAKVQQALTQLPQEVKNTGVTVGIGQTIDLGWVTLYSERGELSRDEIVDYMFGVVSPALQRIQGVGAASVQDEKIAMRVWLDSDRMAALGINTDEVVAAVKAQNVQASLGKVGASPAGDTAARTLALVSKGRLTRPEEFGAIIVRTAAGGGLVYLRDIAKIGLGHETYAHAGMYGTRDASSVHLYQLPGADTLRTVGRIKQCLKDLETRFPGDLKWDMTIDVSRYSLSALRGAGIALAAAFALALLFLAAAFRSLRTALVATVSSLVPLALIAVTLAALGLFITMLTLHALALASAFLVTTAAWSMLRWREGRAAETVKPLLTAGAIVTAASLVLTLIGGVQGVILRQFAVVFAATGVFAVANAIVVVPAFANLLGCGHAGGKTTSGRQQESTAAASAASEKTTSGRQQESTAAAACCRPLAVDGTGAAKSCCRPLVVIVAAALALAAGALMRRLPGDLVPKEDLGIVLVDYKLRDGTVMPVTHETVVKVLERVSAIDGVEKSCTVFGDGIFSPTGENTAKTYIALKPWAERGRGASTGEIIAKMRAAVADIAEAQIVFMTPATVPGIGTINGISPLVLAVGHNDPVRLADEAHRLRDLLKRSPIADTVTCGYNTDAPHLRIKVDREKCELMKVPLSTLFSTLQHYLGSIYVNDVNLGIQVNRVTLMSDWKGRSTPETMAGLFVRSTTGAMVPVSALVEFAEEPGPNTIYRYNRYIYCTVDFGQKNGVSVSDAMKEVGGLVERELPRDFATGWVGLAYEESANPGRMSLMIALALLAAYLVLLVRCESWRRSFFTLLPSVAAVFGGALLLYLTGVSLSLDSRLALIMLVVLTTAFSLFEGGSDGWLARMRFPLLAALMALPLVFTSGVGAAGARSLGMTLVGGYLGYALLSGTLGVRRSEKEG